MTDPVDQLKAAERLLLGSGAPVGLWLADVLNAVRRGLLTFEQAAGLPPRVKLAAQERTRQRDRILGDMGEALYPDCHDGSELARKVGRG